MLDIALSYERLAIHAEAEASFERETLVAATAQQGAAQARFTVDMGGDAHDRREGGRRRTTLPC
jgi:hypothetical protein